MGAKKLNLESLVDLDLDLNHEWDNQPATGQDDDRWHQKVTRSIERQRKHQKNVLWQAYIKEETSDVAIAFCKEHNLSKSELTRILFENFFKEN